jgi:chromosome segregation ATPase
MTRPASSPGRTAAEEVTEVSERPTLSSSDQAADTKEFSRPAVNTDATVVMNPEHGFRLGWRGYDRVDVDEYRSRIESELASTRAAHEGAVRAQAQTSEQLHAAQADIRRLRGQLTNAPTTLSDRLREILHLAAEEADQTRADAEAAADRTRAEGQNDADEIRSRAGSEAQAVVQRARDTAAGIVNQANAEQQRLKAEIEQTHAAARQHLADAKVEATRLRDTCAAELRQQAADADQARERADAEAAARRSEADRLAREQREQENQAATLRINDMNQHLAEVTRRRDETLDTLGRLHEEIAKTLAFIAGQEAPAKPTAR